MTLREAAQSALDVQDAVNLSGVVFTFAEVMQTLCDNFHDTDVRNTHPIVTVFLDKLVNLNRCGYIAENTCTPLCNPDQDAHSEECIKTGIAQVSRAYRLVQEYAETGKISG